MSAVRLRRREAERGHLPRVCVCCGEPATTTVTRKFAWHPFWVWLLLPVGLLPLIIVAIMTTKRMTVQIPFCESHEDHWSWRERVHRRFFGVLVLMLVGSVGVVVAAPRQGDLCAVIGIGCAVVFLTWILTGLILQRMGIQVDEITDGAITLSKVSPEFVSAHREQSRSDDDAEDIVSRSGVSCAVACVLLFIVAPFVVIVMIAAISALGERPQPEIPIIGPAPGKLDTIIDKENRFQLDLPAGWTVLTADHRRENPLVRASAIHESGVLGMILVEPDDGFTVVGVEDELGRGLAESSGFTERKSESISALRFQGEPAVRVRFTGRRRDGASRRVENTAFAHAGRVYQIFVQGPPETTRDDGSNFKEFVNAFSLLPQPTEPGKKPRPNGD